MVHSRSPSWFIPAAFDDGFSTDVHHHGSFTTAARGGLTPAPACRCRRTYLHLRNSMVAVDHSDFYIRTTQLPSGHTNALAETVNGCYKAELIRAARHVNSRGRPSRTSNWPPSAGCTGTTTPDYRATSTSNASRTRTRTRVLRCTQERPTAGRNAIARASIRPSAIQCLTRLRL